MRFTEEPSGTTWAMVGGLVSPGEAVVSLGGRKTGGDYCKGERYA